MGDAQWQVSATSLYHVCSSISLPDTISTMSTGALVAVPVKNDEPVPTSILETARGKDVNVVFEFENYSWSINGKSIDELSGATAAMI